MFTGLIEEQGQIVSREPSGDGERVTVMAKKVLEGSQHGDSISVSGVCLTVVAMDDNSFTADVMAETLRHSTAGEWVAGQPVNLERAAAVGDRLGGHIVQGHIDGTTEVLSITPGDQWSVIRFSLSPDIAPLVAMKGSIALDGVSLTVSGVDREWCEVSLIPETLEVTTLGSLKVGDRVNVETDIVARHVQRLMEMGKEVSA
jgi:riboflavin synthase